ncbi:hypothetical protein [Paracraurococcus ruber]|uniref:Uncharacterized protein n=1 Tax=Paracraurococcus ruber TaxID=77675 RepID=A0ABS1CY21_9PROT|nr:hypothetical protein [Paracraurococcus ruber]MBK1659429.1 hypothetical protein [Paracraurococcus ruber]
MQRIGLRRDQATRLAGLLMATAALASIAGNLPLRVLPRRHRLATGAAAPQAGAIILAPFAGLGLVAAAIAIFGIGLPAPAAMAELMRQRPASRGRIAGQAAARQAAAAFPVLALARGRASTRGTPPPRA